MVSSSAPGSLCSSLNAGIIKDMYFSAGSDIDGQATFNTSRMEHEMLKDECVLNVNQGINI